MSNTLLNPTAILRESLRILHTECQFVKNVDKQHDKETTFGGSKRGASVQIRLPNQYSVRTGWPINLQETVNQTVTLTVATVRGVDMYFTDAELSQNLDDFSNNVLKPAISRLAAEIDYITYQACYKRVYNSVGSAGTTPSAAATYLGAGQKLSEFLTPTSDRCMIVNPAAEAATVGAQIALFNPQAAISKQYTEGQIGRALGFDWYMSQNVPVHTCGSRATASNLQVNATVASEGSTTIAIKGLSGATQTLTEGDVFTVAGCYSVNPETKVSTGALQQFVCTAAATGVASVVSATVSPAIYTSATPALQTVTGFPTENDVITMIGTASTGYPQNLAFAKDFATFATAKLEMPSDVNFKAQEVMDGISMRILRQYDINSANYPCRIDVLCGSLVQRPSQACRVWG